MRADRGMPGEQARRRKAHEPLGFEPAQADFRGRDDAVGQRRRSRCGTYHRGRAQTALRLATNPGRKSDSVVLTRTGHNA